MIISREYIRISVNYVLLLVNQKDVIEKQLSKITSENNGIGY